MKKQKLATVVLAAGLVLGIAVFVGYESTRYTRTVQAAEREWQLGDTEEAIPISASERYASARFGFIRIAFS